LPEPEAWLRRADSALKEAAILLDQGFHGASISRSYYAMFYAARALLATKGVSPKTHGGVLHKLGDLFVKPGLLPSEMTSAMGATMELREQADYEPESAAIDRTRAEEALGAAKRFVGHAGGFLRSH
jgi:uncharacterized protein (UPF0332 family)